MNRRFILRYLLPLLVFFTPLFFSGAWASDTYTWVGGDGDWMDEANWTNDNPDPSSVDALPPIDADVIIGLNVTVTISASDDITVESVVLNNGADLIIANGGSLTTRKGGAPGNDGFRLNGVSGTESTLTVNGTLNINTATDNAPNSGLYIDDYTSVTVASTGVLNIVNAPEFGIQINDDLTNYGTISIVSASDSGIETNGAVSGSKIINYGSMSITSTGGDAINFTNPDFTFENRGTLTITTAGGDAIKLDDGDSSFENHGTVTLSGANSKLLDGSGIFYNYGTFGGSGIVESENDFLPQPGSIISPGTSIGTLTFESNLDLSDVTLIVEINSSTSYDRIIVQGTADVSTTTLSFSGSHTPVAGDIFLIVDSTTGQITGTFTGGPFTLNGSVMEFDNTSGEVSFSSSFPVELTMFTAKPAGKTVQLAWTTASETNNDYFAIEHSTDGRYFKEIGRVMGAGTTQERNDYAFVDSTPATGLNYYRLNQYDFDGAQGYSPVQTVLIDGKNDWTAWPTVAHNRINLDWAEAPPANTIIEAYNLTGQKVYSQPVPEGATQVQVPVQQWASGWYSVVVQQNGAVSSQRVIKE